jgi:opacity protein-like surface antigen
LKHYAACLGAFLVGCAASAEAADLDAPLRSSLDSDLVETGPRWQGLTAGFNVGGMWTPGNSATQIWFPPTLAASPPPGGPYSLSSAGVMGGGQFGFNKQWGGFVFGGEADFDFGGTTARQTASGTFLGAPYSAVQVQRLDSLGTIRARAGYALFDCLLVYGTAGIAFGETQFSSNLSFGSNAFSGSHSDVQVGLTAGGGIEYALGPQWSVGAEFLYYDLGNSHVASTSASGAEIDTTAALKGYTLRLGMNYTFAASDPIATEASPVLASDVSGRFGVRAGMSTSKARMTLYDFTGATMVSRLTYQNPAAATGEVYGQLDHVSGIFFKGYAGLGKENGGSLKDEDFPPGIVPYSSTDSPQKDGRLAYASGDVGYYGLDNGWYKFGGFAGYHFVDEHFNAFGCTQTAGNPDVCAPGQVAPGNLTISDDGRWQSLRLGLAGRLNLPGGFSVRAEAAWLPVMGFSGGNDHWLREPTDFSGTIPESGTGYNGIQAEGELDYALSDNFEIGAGARYWSMNAKGHVAFGSVTPDGGSQVATFTTQRVQAFVQSAYRF